MGDDNRFAMIPLAVLTDDRITFRTLKTFAAICSFRASSNDFLVEASREEIASRCRLNASIISTATTELQRLGWLVKQGAGGRVAGGGGRKTAYTITIPETVSTSVTVAESVTVLKSRTVAKSETVLENDTSTVPDSRTPLYKKEVNRDTAGGFEDFWNLYPKKVAKPEALKAWKRIKPSGRLLALIIAAVEHQKNSPGWKKSGGQFVPNPATWLNGRRWEDETTALAAAADSDNSVFVGAI